VACDALVERVLVRDGRIVGVAVRDDQQLVEIRASRVVVCAGAYGSPAILLRSGIGPSGELAAIGVKPALDLPGVGRNLHDQPCVEVHYEGSSELAGMMERHQAETGWQPHEQVIAKFPSAGCRQGFDLHIYPVGGYSKSRRAHPRAPPRRHRDGHPHARHRRPGRHRGNLRRPGTQRHPHSHPDHFETDEYVARALRAGASGFLGKTATTDDLLAGIRTIASGDSLLSPQATRALITRFLATPDPGNQPEHGDILASLTAREQEIMALAAQGHSNDDIAASLFLSTNTVRTHIQRAMMKLHARDRAQLVVIAYQTGLVQPAPPP
jgi:DNA-binding CsgD family transcriptional regulator